MPIVIKKNKLKVTAIGFLYGKIIERKIMYIIGQNFNQTKEFDIWHLTIAEINLSENGSDPGYTTTE